MELAYAREHVREQERGRIARELHDELQQPLALIRMNLAQIALQVGAGDPGVIPLLAEIDAVAIAAIDSTRRIVNELRPQVLDDLGLEAAIAQLVDQFVRRSEITMSLTIRGDLDGALRHWPMAADCIYRVTQEALNNIAKHSRAERAAVDLMIATDSRLVLCIRDHGVGISPSDRRKPAAFGLLGMRERVRAVQGALRIDGRPGAGTRVELTLAARSPRPGR